MLRRRSFLIASLSLITMVSLAIAAPKQKKGKEEAGSNEGPASLEGKAAPEFSAETLDGKKVSLAEEKGNVVLMDFWATWCPPCRKSLPHIQELSADKELAGKGLKVWAVQTNWRGDTQEKGKAFVKQNNYTFTVPFDNGGAAKDKFLATGIPTTVLVGRDGKVKKAWVGFNPEGANEMKKAIEDALKEEAPSKAS